MRVLLESTSNDLQGHHQKSEQRNELQRSRQPLQSFASPTAQTSGFSQGERCLHLAHRCYECIQLPQPSSSTAQHQMPLPPIATILVNSYRSPTELFVDCDVTLSQEGTTQGDPLAMAMYGLATIPLIRRLNGPCKQVCMVRQ